MSLLESNSNREINVRILPNREVYDGQFQDGQRHGPGTLTYPNGGKYEGRWQDGKRHGLGTMTLPDGAN